MKEVLFVVCAVVLSAMIGGLIAEVEVARTPPLPKIVVPEVGPDHRGYSLHMEPPEVYKGLSIWRQ